MEVTTEVIKEVIMEVITDMATGDMVTMEVTTKVIKEVITDHITDMDIINNLINCSLLLPTSCEQTCGEIFDISFVIIKVGAKEGQEHFHLS